LPFALRKGQVRALRSLSAGAWLRLALLGVLFYAVTQGAQFLSLAYLPAATASLVLSFSTIAVAFLGLFVLGERPTWAQWIGASVYLAGVLVYLYPIALPSGQALGLLVAVVGMLANALSAVLGRQINRSTNLSPLAVTVVSMGIGGLLLLVVGVGVQGLPRLSWANWGIVLWLAVVNSALAYTLWNRANRTLAAVESSVINNTMLFQIAVLAWWVLGERLSLGEGLGILLAAAGTLAVQLARRE
jgi:drug/metabolite transporter (DMT)-like permease